MHLSRLPDHLEHERTFMSLAALVRQTVLLQKEHLLRLDGVASRRPGPDGALLAVAIHPAPGLAAVGGSQELESSKGPDRWLAGVFETVAYSTPPTDTTPYPNQFPVFQTNCG